MTKCAIDWKNGLTEPIKFYATFLYNDENGMINTKHQNEDFLLEILDWMNKSKLKLNQDNMELLLIHSTFRKDPAFAPLSFGTEIIALSKSAKNIGVTIGSTMSFSIRIGLICKSSFVHQRNIARIPKYVPFKTIATLIRDFVTPKIDYCNSVLYGYPVMNSEITTGS